MRCAACHRKLTQPAFTAPASAGGWVLGPVCLFKRDLSDHIMRVLDAARMLKVMRRGSGDAQPVKRKRAVRVIPVTRKVKVLPGQLDLFEPAL